MASNRPVTALAMSALDPNRIQATLSGVLGTLAGDGHAAKLPALFPGGITKIRLNVNVQSWAFEIEVSGPDPAKPGAAAPIEGSRQG